MPLPSKGSQQLRVGRASIPWSTYLLTFCTHERKSGLATTSIMAALCGELTRMESDAIWQPQAFVVMPDHMHLIVVLNDTLALGKAIARLKSRTRTTLEAQSLRWQAGYHDHRLRPDDARLPICYYLFMNPVRAGLVEDGARWPFHWWRPEVWTWFKPYTQAVHPDPEWTKNLP